MTVSILKILLSVSKKVCPQVAKIIVLMCPLPTFPLFILTDEKVALRNVFLIKQSVCSPIWLSFISDFEAVKSKFGKVTRLMAIL